MENFKITRIEGEWMPQGEDFTNADFLTKVENQIRTSSKVLNPNYKGEGELVDLEENFFSFLDFEPKWIDGEPKPGYSIEKLKNGNPVKYETPELVVEFTPSGEFGADFSGNTFNVTVRYK